MPHASRLGNAAALAAVAVAALTLVRPSLPRDARAIHVEPAGNDWRRGRTPSSAVATLQRAADLARPGDTILIAPGIYRERLRVRRGGEPGRPVVFRAAKPGTITISGEAPPRVAGSLRWRPEGEGIFSAGVPWPVYRVRVGERNAFHVRWEGVDRLRRLAALEGAWDVAAYEPRERRLYLRVRGGGDPEVEGVAIHDRIPPPREWGNIRAANVWVEAGHLVFEGIRFRGGVGAGLHLWDAGDVVVRDCLFEGAEFGIRTAPRARPPRAVTVEYSVYHNYPQHHWLNRWVPWGVIYAEHASSTLIASADPGVVVRHNLISHAGDALRLTAETGGGPANVVIHDNLVFRTTDDAVEFDGPGRGVVFRHNLVYDPFVALALSPVTAGPVLVEENLVLSPADGWNGAQLKLTNPGERRGDTASVRNVTVRRNTFVGRWLAWSDRPVADVRFEGNVFAVRRTADPPLPPGSRTAGNAWIRLPDGPYPDPATDPRWWDRTAERPAAAGARPAPGGSGVPGPGPFPEATVAPDGSRPSEPAGSGPGPAGAVPPGGRWTMPRPGPRWLDPRELPAAREAFRTLSPLLFR